MFPTKRSWRKDLIIEKLRLKKVYLSNITIYTNNTYTNMYIFGQGEGEIFSKIDDKNKIGKLQ